MNKAKKDIEGVLNDLRETKEKAPIADISAAVFASIVAVDGGADAAKMLREKEPGLYSAFMNSILSTIAVNLAVHGKSGQEAIAYLASLEDRNISKKGIAVVSERGAAWGKQS